MSLSDIFIPYRVARSCRSTQRISGQPADVPKRIREVIYRAVLRWLRPVCRCRVLGLDGGRLPLHLHLKNTC